MTERLPGIFEFTQTSTSGGGISEIHIYLIPGGPGRRSLMIDAGFGERECLERTKAAMAELGLSFADLDVFLTHEHYDHSGLAGELARLGARIFMNPEEEKHHYTCLYHRRSADANREQEEVLRTVGVTPELEPGIWKRYQDALRDEEQNVRLSWVIGDFPFLPIYPGQVFSYGGYVLRAFRLRGHSFGQMGLYDDERRVVFLADQVLNRIVPIVSTSFEGEGLLASYFDSLSEIKRRFAGYDALPAHAGPVADLPAQVERIAISYLDKLDRISHIVNALAEPETVCRAACTAYGIQKIPESDREFVQVKSMITKTFSCLEFLAEKGFVEKTRADGVLYWGPGPAYAAGVVSGTDLWYNVST